MQGFNKYYPPDFDPRQTETLNGYRGVHALGKRAKDLDKGILVVRFELPFNIWCGSCNAHLGAGVRYNAQKLKVGNYYSTPIYAFRCKCHLCSGWFEIRTDPQNARYVVHEGARAQVQDWDPEENGGFAVHDTEAPSATDKPQDAFAHLEKQVVQKQTIATKSERLTELTDLSDRLHGDPYANSQLLRRHFRKEKKVENELLQKDANLKQKYGLADRISLDRLDPAEQEKERSVWKQIKNQHPSRITPLATVPDLAKLVKENTRKRYDPFDSGNGKALPQRHSGGSIRLGVKAKGKGKALALTRESESTPSSSKRRRLLEDEEEVDDQLGVEDEPLTLGSASRFDEAVELPSGPLPTDTAQSKQSAKVISGLASELLAYGSDEDEDEIGQAHKHDSIITAHPTIMTTATVSQRHNLVPPSVD